MSSSGMSLSGAPATASRKIIHVDMDAFYASVEQRDNPELKGRPVAVGRGAARGVVAAASYEARVFGVRSAMPSTTALRKCPELIFVKPRFEVYRAISQEIRAIFARYTPLIEPLSLDEAYLDVTENLQGLPTATGTAKAIRAEILKATGLTASAGISYNKFLAKLASDQNKPNGQFVIKPGMGAAFVANLPVGKFHGIGPVTAAKMNRLGIVTGADLAHVPVAQLVQHFGKAGRWYSTIARGEDDRRVNADRIRKSSGCERTYLEDLTALPAIDEALAKLADEVWGWCEKTNIYGRTVTVKVKYADFQQVTRAQSAAQPVASREELYRLSCLLVRRAPLGEKGIRLLGVTVSGFPEQEAEHPDGQLDLLAEA
ncbi:DNA polymerase IV [Methyloligella sp. 2.7D]|uniref:DNA polymerase IV n=1 Tax=unclassified Methyloligella TaxID=2625955 RepID=UPI001ABB48BB|nr:DNA polymerase IV [Methyloligella sp. GL2]